MLKHIKLNGQTVLVMFQTDANDKANTEIQKVFYHELDVLPLFGEDVVEQIVDLVMTGDYA